MLPLKLDRPLAALDIEATGITPLADRIVELAIIRVAPDGTRETRTWRVNPGIPIPSEATAIHGIRDADVAACPPFVRIAEEVYYFLEGCDLVGYNLARYDIPMLTEEFRRADVRFDVDNRRVIDAQRIFHRREPRDLTAALAFYCGATHDGAHGAVADAEATLRVLEGQFAKYPDLPRDLDALNAYCSPRRANWVDRVGRLRWENGEVVLNFGRMKGTSLKTLIADEPGFLQWLLRGDFPRDTKEIVKNALANRWPEPPKSPPASAGADDEAG
jgi:DNA polymerase-3 subunit epsilon